MVPPGLLDCVFYLYPSVEDAHRGTNFGGTGFLVSVAQQPGGYQLWAVTNRHVVASGERPARVLRFNRLDGSTECAPSESTQWHWEDGGDDIAIARVHLWEQEHRFCPVALDGFVSEELARQRHLGPGDDVFMVGRFVDHDGALKNEPSLRFGNISKNPTLIEGRGSQSLSYILDMRSRAGYSGSPVFVYRQPGSNLENIVRHFNDGSDTGLWLLGIHWDQFREEWLANLRGGEKVAISGVSGMTMAVPAWRIARLISQRAASATSTPP